jgi:hypothetical protein
MKFLFLPVLVIISLSCTYSQGTTTITNEDRVIDIKKSTSIIKLDGVLDDVEWSEHKQYGDFWMKFPSNVTKADPLTEVKLTYDEKFLYVGIKAYVNQSDLIVQSLKRDQGLRKGDGVAIVLDPVGLKTNGFYFSVSPFNSQTEGQIAPVDEDISFTWDNTWYSETKISETFYTVEIAIPFSILRYDPSKSQWGINFIRSARKENEFHTWCNIPLQFRGTDLGYLGALRWDQRLPSGGSKFSINPYITGGIESDPGNNVPTKAIGNIGLDAKVALSSSINLDLTINPDFSNTDVDVQVTNLTRFSLFFPERRIFFLENDDLFSSFGIPPVRPFYSRRIGSKNDVAVPILFGARLTGNLNKNLRLGAMNIQTGRKGDNAADNFTAVTLTQKVLERSQIKGYFINRTALQNDKEKLSDPVGAYGRNTGLELNFVNKAGTINGWANGHLSLKPGISDKNAFVNTGGGYFGENFTSFIDYFSIGTNYYADVGFVNRIENYDALRDTIVRRGNTGIYNETGYTWRKFDKTFNSIEFGTENFYAVDDLNKFNEFNTKIILDLNFKNSSMIGLTYAINSFRLLYPFSFVDDENSKPLEVGVYNFNFVEGKFTTDQRKNFIFGGGVSLGKYYSADYKKLSTSITVRQQPKYSFSVMAEWNNLKFPTGYGEQDIFLVAPQIEINFSNKIFWTNFLQWNSQSNKFNINSRLQYRYRPMSDMFVVFSDDYITAPTLGNQYRSIIFKVNYWLNI